MNQGSCGRALSYIFAGRIYHSQLRDYEAFTPLESPSIFVGDGGNTCKSRSISSLLRAGLKPCPF